MFLLKILEMLSDALLTLTGNQNQDNPETQKRTKQEGKKSQ